MTDSFLGRPLLLILLQIFLGKKLNDEPRSLEESVKIYLFAIHKFKADEKWDPKQFSHPLLTEFLNEQVEQ